MKKQLFRWLGAAGAIGLAATLVASKTWAEPTQRKQVDQNGDFLVFGNSLGWDCNEDTSNILVGNANCGTASNSNTSDTAIDLYWQAAASEQGSALATSSNTATSARSTAALVLPSGAQVSYARVYWAAYQPANGSPGRSVQFEVPQGSGAASLTADDCFTAYAYGNDGEFWYQCTAEVTALLQASGAGPYTVSGVSSVNNLAGANNQVALSGWSIVVFYASPNEPTRNLTLFDGLDSVATQSSRTVNLTGFLVPNSGYRAKLGVIAYEGDAQNTGDQLLFNGAPLSDALNPETNFFNSTRSTLGIGDNHDGDLPRLTGAPGSMGGIDLDVIEVTSQVRAGDTSATIVATSTSDRFALGAFVTSISTLRPDLSGAVKRVADLNGDTVRPNDVLEYTITIPNNGNDTAVETLLTDTLSSGVTYVPSSLVIVTPQTALLTDAKDDDAGEFDPLSRTISVRLTAASNGAQPGIMAPNTSTAIRFRVQVNRDTSGNIDNQANVTAAGLLGAPSAAYLTDGDAALAGIQTTRVFVIAGCIADGECVTPTPYCAAGDAPRICVGCLTDSDCGTPDSGRICSTTHSCAPGCRVSGGNGCPQGTDCVLNGTLTGSCEQKTLTDAGIDDAGTGVDAGAGGTTALLPETRTEATGGSIAVPTGGAWSGGSAPVTTTVLPSSTGGAPVMATTTRSMATGGVSVVASTSEPASTGGAQAIGVGGAATGGVMPAISSTTRFTDTGGTRTSVIQTYLSEDPSFEGSGCECRAAPGRNRARQAWLGVGLAIASVCFTRRTRQHRRGGKA